MSLVLELAGHATYRFCKSFDWFVRPAGWRFGGSQILDPGQPAGWQVVGPVVGSRISKTLPETADRKMWLPETADPKKRFPETADSKTAVSRDR